jgi:hypothetical protein
MGNGFYGGAVAVAFVLVKEFWFDLKYEDAETSGGIDGGARDAAFYGVGIAAALLILSVKWLWL